MTTTEVHNYPATPDSSLYLSCLDSAIRSFYEPGSTVEIVERANAFFDALKSRSSS